jgi:hypothetical protein
MLMPAAIFQIITRKLLLNLHYKVNNAVLITVLGVDSLDLSGIVILSEFS